MKIKALPLAIIYVAGLPISGFSAAAWSPGGCPGGGSSPCVETQVSGNTFHFNGSGGSSGVWHGNPIGGDFEFVTDDMDLDCDLAIDCSLVLQGQVKKCLDSSGSWRIGIRLTSAYASDGLFCNTATFGNFPWYSKDSTISNHCPFEDDCDTLIPYHPAVSAYTFNLGAIDMEVVGMTLVNGEHLHNVTFISGLGASLLFNSSTYDCDENESCAWDGILTLDNATSLSIY